MEDYPSYEFMEHCFTAHPVQEHYECHPHPPPLDRTSSSSSSSHLHSVRKPPSKPWRTTTKPAVAYHVPGAGDSRPSASPPKVYRVDPRGFRQLVQKLTGASTGPAHQPAPGQRRLRDAAPAPLQLFHHAPLAVQKQQPQQHHQLFVPARPQHPAPQHHDPYAMSYQPVPALQLKPAEVVGAAAENDAAPGATYDQLPQQRQQQQQTLLSPAAPKTATGCQSPGGWSALLSPSIFSAWCSLPLQSPLLSPGTMTPIETSTVN